MAGLDPAIHRASVREQVTLFGAQTRAGWMAASVGGHDVEKSDSIRFMDKFDQVDLFRPDCAKSGVMRAAQ